MDDTVRLGIIEAEDHHPLLWTEQMMPILPITRVRDADQGIDFAVEAEYPRCHTFVMHSVNLSNLSRIACECNASVFVKNGPALAGLGWKGEGHTSFTIASPTGEGMTSPRSFSRWRRCTWSDTSGSSGSQPSHETTNDPEQRGGIQRREASGGR